MAGLSTFKKMWVSAEEYQEGELFLVLWPILLAGRSGTDERSTTCRSGYHLQEAVRIPLTTVFPSATRSVVNYILLRNYTYPLFSSCDSPSRSLIVLRRLFQIDSELVNSSVGVVVRRRRGLRRTGHRLEALMPPRFSLSSLHSCSSTRNPSSTVDMDPPPDDVHSDTDGEYTPHSPNPAFPPNRPPGDTYSHLDFVDSVHDDSDSNFGGSDSDSDVQGSSSKRPIPERVGNFVLLAKHKIDVAPHIRVAKWRSEKSGLKVIWADTPVSPSRQLVRFHLRKQLTRCLFLE